MNRVVDKSPSRAESSVLPNGSKSGDENARLLLIFFFFSFLHLRIKSTGFT